MLGFFKKKTKARKKLDSMKDAIENALMACGHFDSVYNGVNTIIIDNTSSITIDLVQISYKLDRLMEILNKEEETDDDCYRLY
jgi:hypothetical protein